MTASNFVLIGIKTIKDSNKIKDMFDFNSVKELAFEMGFFETANWITNNSDDYFLLYMKTDWNNVPTLIIKTN